MPGPNPFRGDRVQMFLGDFLVPGTITSITDADREWEWTVQKGTDKSGATTVAKGTKIAEGIQVVTVANTEEDFDALYDFRDLVTPAPGQKPPTFAVDCWPINFHKITRLGIKKFSQPTWDAGANKWSVTCTFIEFMPSTPTNAGPADPAKPGADGGDASGGTINASAAKAGKVAMAKADT